VALHQFVADLNKIDTTMPDTTIRIAALSLEDEKSAKKAYKWLSGLPEAKPIIKQLSKYPFLHTAKLIPEKRIEEMGYVKQQSVWCISFSIDLVLIS